MAVDVKLCPLGGAGWQFFDNNGVPLTGGKLYIYAAGTTTPVDTYTTSAGTVLNPNPVILNSSGRTSNEIWQISGTSVKIRVTDTEDVIMGTDWDNVPGINDNPSGIAQVYADFANTADITKGDALVGFRQSYPAGLFTGAVGRTVHQKLQEITSILDFGADPTGTVDSTSAIQLALNIVNALGTGRQIYIPAGKYRIDSTILVYEETRITGAVSGTDLFATILLYTGAGTAVRLSNDTAGKQTGSIFLENLSILTSVTSSIGGTGVSVQASKCVLNNVYIGGSTLTSGFQRGISVPNTVGGYSNLTLNNVHVTQSGLYGLDVENLTNLIINGGSFTKNTTLGMQINTVNGFSLNGCYSSPATNSGASCIQLTNVYGYSITTCNSDVTGFAAQRFVRLISNCKGGKIEANNLNSSTSLVSSSLISVESSTVVGCSIQHNNVTNLSSTAQFVSKSGTGSLAYILIGDNQLAGTAGYMEFDSSWTPSVTFAGGTTGLVATQIGSFYRTLSQITLTLKITFSNLGSSTGGIYITNLPAPCKLPQQGATLATSNYYNGDVFITAVDAGTLGTACMTRCYIVALTGSADKIYLDYINSAGNQNVISEAQITASSVIYATITYPV